MDSHQKTFSYKDPHFPVRMVRMQGSLPELTELHWHEELQFTICKKGHIEITLEGHSVSLQANEALFINRTILHQIRYASPDAEYLTLNFSEDILSFHSDSRMDIKYVKPYTYSYHVTGLLFNNHTDWQNDILQHLYRIFDLYTENNLNCKEYQIAIHLVQIWLLICTNIKESITLTAQPRLNKNQLVAIQSMLSFIYEHYHEKIELKDIAASGHVSPTECGRIFKSFTKLAPYHYLLHYRLQRSLDYLIHHHHLTVTEIAIRVGFNQPSSFIQQFTEMYGTTPKQYRLNLIASQKN
ncbi:AraC family transcriptional regulator [Streptococcus sp. DD10]|uniref:AraC family transcriptional regulator n=1 Tax=Streptococcus sp. DD10 TaxID=1777878 RepID=UPI000B192DCF|nr:helix-turn-helix domain-containing protein [Streptococcus sp. DD10]